jgi:hypothetical protein
VTTISLPTKERTLVPYTTGEPIQIPSQTKTVGFNQIAYAAARVVAHRSIADAKGVAVAVMPDWSVMRENQTVE